MSEEILKWCLRSVIDAAPDPAFLVEQAEGAGTIFEINRKAEKLLGWARKDLLGTPAGRFCVDGELRCVRKLEGRQGDEKPEEVIFARRDGTTIPVEVNAAALEIGELKLIQVVFRDITGRREFEERLRESEARYRDLFENAIDPIFIVDENLRYVDLNRRAVEVFGYSREEFLSMRIPDLIPREQLPQSNREFEKLRREGAYETFEGRLRHKNGEWLDIEVSSSAIFRDGRFLGSRDIVRDVTRRKKAERELIRLNRLLQEQATHDHLTGLPNRRLLKDRMEQAFRRAMRTGLKVGVAFVDLDDFKKVNDRFGHRTGDEVLRTLSKRLRSKIRQSDTVARMGGDEFIILLENLRTRGDGRVALRNLGTAFDDPFDVEGHEFRLNASFGLSLFPDDGKDPENLIGHADSAMYRRKKRP